MMVVKLVMISCITVLLNVSGSARKSASPVYQRKEQASDDNDHSPGARLASVSPLGIRHPACTWKEFLAKLVIPYRFLDTFGVRSLEMKL